MSVYLKKKPKQDTESGCYNYFASLSLVIQDSDALCLLKYKTIKVIIKNAILIFNQSSVYIPLINSYNKINIIPNKHKPWFNISIQL